MAGSPKYKVFSPSGEYVSSCKYAEDAAAIIASYGKGASIRLGHKKSATLFTVRSGGVDSFDLVRDECHRVEAERKKACRSTT